MLNQDKKVNLEIRKNRPQTLAAAFGGFMEMFGIRAADADLSKNWSNIVGLDIAKIANLVAVKQTKSKTLNIVLKPVSTAFALELTYKIEEIKNKVNKYYGYDAVAKITIRK